MTIKHVISEIENCHLEPTRKAVIDINRLLQNNKLLLLKSINDDSAISIFTNFENMSQVSYHDYNSTSFKEDYLKQYHLLNYYLNKIY